MSDLICPWCGESGFDLIGLKLHILNGNCDSYEQIEVVPGPFGLEATKHTPQPPQEGA